MGKSAQKRQSGTRKGTGIKGRPRNDGLPPIQSAQRQVILGKHPDPAPPPPPAKKDGQEGDVQTVAFPVEDCATVRESLDVNGASLVNDAFRRASRLESNFDQAVYLTLLGKAKPIDSATKLPGTKKQQLRELERIMASSMSVQDAEFAPVQSITGPTGPQQGGNA
jgi:hypothetical protein